MVFGMRRQREMVLYTQRLPHAAAKPRLPSAAKRFLRTAASAAPLVAVVVAGTAPTTVAQPVRDDFYVTNGPVHAAALSGNALYIGGAFTWVGPATGAGVPIDAATGLPEHEFPRVIGSVCAVASDGAGGWYIGGEFTSVGGVARNNLAHVLRDNSVSAWNPGANARVRTLAAGPAAVYVGGFFTTVGGQVRNRLAALDPATGQATSWDPNADDLVDALAVVGPTIFAGGNFTTIGGQPRSYLAALDASTGQATAWNPDPNGRVQAMALHENTLYVGGSFTLIGGLERR